MTTAELMNNELRHRYAGNGYAVVEVLPLIASTLTGKMEAHVRVTDKWCRSNQAFLAAVDHLEIATIGSDIARPVELTEDELENLRPLRDGIKDGSIKVINTRFVKQTTATTP